MKSWLSMTRGLQVTVEVPGEETAGHRDGSDHGGCCAAFLCVGAFLLTVDFIVFPEDHLHMIPLQKSAFPIEGLGKHDILVSSEGKGLHR